MVKYIFDETLVKMGIVNQEVLDEAIGLGVDHLKICGECSEWKLCVYISLVNLVGEYRVLLRGLLVQIPASKELDENTSILLKLSNTVVSEKGMVSFYIPRNYSIGVYYILCSSVKPGWSEWSPVDESEITYFQIEGVEE